MPNRLGDEKSPYLQQHARNPVDWYPWGAEAFMEAQKQNKPVFLSIGYATCHWCHVMEKESFQSPEIAKLLNEHFINIKVDREEHPEVDSIYMDFAQALIGGGAGWPLNLFLTPNLKPFFAATYLPIQSGRGQIGFADLIEQIRLLWNGDDRPLVIEQAEKIVEMFAHTSNATGHELPSGDDLANGAEKFFSVADAVYGGFKGEPKFPLSYPLELLLGLAKKTGDGRALFYVDLTLEMMRRGGIFDHVGGGFSRYAVDEKWEIPHFEKMLYDNALLARAYASGWKYTKKEEYAKACRATCDYLLRELSHPEGGFYSGEDADSLGREGIYYTWAPAEVEELLSPEEAELFCALFDVTHAGNFHGRNVLHMENSEEEFASAFNLDRTKFLGQIEEWRKKLLQKRSERERPSRDEKILVSWNGLAIDALAEAGAAFGEKAYLEAAEKAAEFIGKELWKEGRLLHRFCFGESKFSAVLEDYAFFIRGLLTLFEKGRGKKHLEKAIEMAKILERDFKEIEGAFYQTDGKESLVLRKCEFYDGAEPSGNAVQADNLLRLYQITKDESFLKQAEDVLKAANSYIKNFAPGASFHLLALHRYLDKNAPTIVIALDEAESLKAEIMQALGRHFCLNGAIIWKKGGDALAPESIAVGGKTTFYVCRQNACEAPLTKFEEIAKVIETL